jgi:hypothetical protein
MMTMIIFKGIFKVLIDDIFQIHVSLIVAISNWGKVHKKVGSDII